MPFIVLTLVLCLFALVLPKTWFIIEVVFIAPLIGIALGGVAWSAAAGFHNELITLRVFGAFIAVGIGLAETGLALVRRRERRA